MAYEVIARSVDRLRESLHVAPQTNEVGRSAALVVGLLRAARHTGLDRIRLLEPGASAGLNLLVDHYRYLGDGWEWGDPTSSVVIDGVGAQGVSATPLTIVERRGCDLHPIDAASPEGALRLESFVWPFQVPRFERLAAALLVAKQHPVTVDRAGAGEWLEAQLAGPAPGGVLTVVWQSITAQYWPAEESAYVDDVIASARSRMPLARVRVESPADRGYRITDHSGDLPVLDVDGEPIARVDYHGPPITWLA